MTKVFLAISLVIGIILAVFYLGIPNIESAIFSPVDQKNILSACANNSFFCQGFSAILPLISTFFVKVSILGWYIILSLIIFGAIFEYFYLTNKTKISIRPIYILIWFTASLYLLFTLLSFNLDPRDTFIGLVKNPQKALQNQLNSEQIQSLEKNQQDLESLGCINSNSPISLNPRLYEINYFCIQEGFFSKALPYVLFISIFILEILSLGKLILRFFKLKVDATTEVLLSTGLGICGWISLVWYLAATAFLNTFSLVILIFIISTIAWKQIVYWLKILFKPSWEVQIRSSYLQTFLVWFLIIILSLSFLAVLHPMPIGADDSLSYINRPHLLSEYGHLIPSMDSFQWEYLTSIGFILFGPNSDQGVVSALVINWSLGLMAVVSIMSLLKIFYKKSWGILAAIFYYLLPMVGYFSFQDLKIDNAIFVMISVIFLAVFEYIKSGSKKWLIMAGLFSGFALSIKITALMEVLAIVVLIMFFLVGSIKTKLLAIMFYILLIILTISPWIILGIFTNPNFKSIDFVIGSPSAITSKVTLYPSSGNQILRTLPSNLTVNLTSPSCLLTGLTEEQGRYSGQLSNPLDFLFLPFKTILSLNVSGSYVITSFIFILTPIILMVPFFWKRENLWLRLLSVQTLVLISVWTIIGHGVIWYGIGFFLGLVIILEILVYQLKGFKKTGFLILIVISLLINMTIFLNNFQKNDSLLFYPMNLASADLERDLLVDHVDQIKNTVFERYFTQPDRPYLYMVGNNNTTYFIPYNSEILGVDDTRLDLFNCLYQEHNASLTLQRLSALGFNSFLLNRTIAKIETDPNGTLHKKEQLFEQFVQDPQVQKNLQINSSKSGKYFILIP